jgi:hypothetical protein
VYEVYGGEAAGSLLSSLGRTLTLYLAMHAQTCGMSDFILTAAAERERRKLLEQGAAAGLAAAATVATGAGEPGGRAVP